MKRLARGRSSRRSLGCSDAIGHVDITSSCSQCLVNLFISGEANSGIHTAHSTRLASEAVIVEEWMFLVGFPSLEAIFKSSFPVSNFWKLLRQITSHLEGLERVRGLENALTLASARRALCCVGMSAGLRATEAKPCLGWTADGKLLTSTIQVFFFFSPCVAKLV